MLTCFQAAQRSYVPEEQVYDFTSSRTDAVGIVERGQVSLIRIDEAGVATVLEDMGPGGVFGRHLAFAGFATDSLEVVARTACDILFIDNSCIFKRCENACTHHSTLVYNMMNLLSNKTRSLSERVDVLSRRSIREKLLCYFRQQTEKSRGGCVHAALLPECSGGLHRHGPQRHDAGAAAFEGAGDRLHRRAADPPLGGAADGLNM